MGACCIQYVLLLSLLGFFPCSGEGVEEQLATIIWMSESSTSHVVSLNRLEEKTITDMGGGNHVQRPEKDLVSGNT